MLRSSRAVCLLPVFLCWAQSLTPETAGAEPVSSPSSPVPSSVTIERNIVPRYFNVQEYVVAGSPLLPTNTVVPLLSKYTGTNVDVGDMVKAASALQLEYHNQGYPAICIAFVPEQTTNGIVTFNVAQSAISQIMVSGESYIRSGNGPALALNPSTAPTNAIPSETTNAVPPAISRPFVPATPEEMARARAALARETAELDAEAKDTRIHVVSTNAGPRFDVEHYDISGNSVLSPGAIGQTLTNIDGAFGTNVSIEGIKTAAIQLDEAYHDRGFGTVTVDLPPQTITNATVKLQVLEGRLVAIIVTANHHFSSNNVMRALPSLHTNMVLNVPIFNAELNRANASQNRQIYPVIGPGPTPGTSDLDLLVKDRLPLHAKVDLDNQSSPGTPDLRVNGSAVYDNLWQHENSLGLQYGFSPELYKLGNQWDFYDQPEVAYYSAFYRLPLGSPEAIASTVAASPGSFGYSEATRQFRVPPSSGQADLTLYATRATIDTGLETLLNKTLFNYPDVREVSEQRVQEGITVNEDVGFQLSKPLPQVNSFHPTLSGGLDYKVYEQENYQTNIFTFVEYTRGPGGSSGQLIERTSHVDLQTPTTIPVMDYLPLELNFNASLNNFMGPATFGLGMSANLWYSSTTTYSSSSTNPPASLSGVKSLQSITGSSESTGYWLILKPSYSQQIEFYTNWITLFRLDGQWASEPLISTEQFGAGGVNSVRGYHEGEVFGDDGWHLSLEQQTPWHTVGMIGGNTPLSIRGSIYMDYARVDLIDPQGRQGSTPLWGTGFGLSASAGPHWQAQFLFSWPLLSTLTTPAYQPFFNFGLTAQF